MLCSPDAPFSSRGPQSPHLQLGRASGPYHSDVDSTPLRASCGVRTGDLLCSQNKHYHNPRKPFWYLSVPLGVRDNGVPGLGDCPLVKRHVREGLGIPAEAGPCSPPGASVGRGHGDHSIIPSAGLVPSPVSGTGGAGSQPQSHLWGSPQMGWRGGREASGNTILTNTMQGVAGKPVWVLGASSLPGREGPVDALGTGGQWREGGSPGRGAGFVGRPE